MSKTRDPLTIALDGMTLGRLNTLALKGQGREPRSWTR